MSRIEFWLCSQARPWILIILNKDINIRPYNWVLTLLILFTEHHSHENFNQLHVCIGYTYHVISHGVPALYHLYCRYTTYNPGYMFIVNRRGLTCCHQMWLSDQSKVGEFLLPSLLSGCLAVTNDVTEDGWHWRLDGHNDISRQRDRYTSLPYICLPASKQTSY